MSFWTNLFGDASSAFMTRAKPIVDKTNGLEPVIKELSDEALSLKTAEFKERLTSGETLDDILPEAFACVREAARRTLGQRHFDVQLAGGLALHLGIIAEMKTGEGKTLVATLPVYLNALSGKGVHVITVNDYLARRDAAWMGQIYNALGLSVAVLNHESSFLYDPKQLLKEIGEKEEEALDEKRDLLGSFKVVHEFLRPVNRREAYLADITYGTNHEFGFDYLRDNLSYGANGLVQRSEFPHNYAVVDEIDSILIDEARTPLIISAPVAEAESLYKTFAEIALKLEPEVHYSVDEKRRQIALNDNGIETAEKLLNISNMYSEGGVKYVHYLETAIRAQALFHRDTEYVVKDGEVIIVDQSTGRLQPGRRWSEGLHQAVEAKEGVKLKEESRTFASVSFQNYFRLYKKLSGMTGTAITSAEEFGKVYGLETISVPTNKPALRADLEDQVFQTETGKFRAIARTLKELHSKGQPVLVGTVSIEKSELLASYLKTEGVPFEILNAKNHEREGEIIAQAGKRGGVVISTNMAGRGVDIKLGGIPATTEATEEVKKLGGLFVLGTERHEARRIDNQLRGRSGRQGDPGTTQFYLSLEDDLMRIFASDMVKKMMGRFGIPEDEPIQNRLVSRSIEAAQTKIEGFNFDARKYLLDYDDVMNHQRKIIYERRRKILLGDEEYVFSYLENLMTQAEAPVQEFIKKELDGEMRSQVLERFRQVALQVIDYHWVEHLETMDHLQSSVRLRAYGQRDPLVEYKREGLQLFKALEASISAQIVSMIPSLSSGPIKSENVELKEIHAGAKIAGHQNLGRGEPSTKSEIGRNDPCPCGSGKKNKNCGLKNTEEHKRLIGEKA